MGTYNQKKVIADYANGRITPEMAIGHTLQHIDELYQAQATTNSDYRELKKQVKQMEDELKRLQTQVAHWQKRKIDIDRLQTLEDGLIALNLTVYAMRADVDSLIVHTKTPPSQDR